MFEFPNDFVVYINAVILLFFIFVLYRGYKRGLLLQIIDLVSTIASVIIAWLFAPVMVKVYSFFVYRGTGMSLVDRFVSDEANKLVWFVILFIGIRLLLLILTPIASLISKMPLIKQVNSVIGGIFSFFMFFVYMVLLNYFLTFPIVKNGEYIIEKTVLKYVNQFTQPVVKVLDEKMQENEIIQSLISQKGLTEEQQDKMADWLKQNNFSQEDIEEFLGYYE